MELSQCTDEKRMTSIAQNCLFFPLLIFGLVPEGTKLSSSNDVSGSLEHVVGYVGRFIVGDQIGQRDHAPIAQGNRSVVVAILVRFVLEGFEEIGRAPVS